MHGETSCVRTSFSSKWAILLPRTIDRAALVEISSTAPVADVAHWFLDF